MDAGSLLKAANAVGFLAASLSFLVMWRRTKEPLFLAFTTSLLLFGAGQALGALMGANLVWTFLLKLSAFSVLILVLLADYKRKSRVELTAQSASGLAGDVHALEEWLLSDCRESLRTGSKDIPAIIDHLDWTLHEMTALEGRLKSLASPRRT